MNKSILLLILLIPVFQLNAQKKDKTEHIIELLELTGSTQMGEQVMNQLISIYKMNMPEIPDEVWKEMTEVFNVEEFDSINVPIYDKYFTHEEIIELIEFYHSPIGMKLLEVQPKILQESMEAGQEWGMKKNEELMERLKSKGYIE